MDEKDLWSKVIADPTPITEKPEIGGLITQPPATPVKGLSDEE
jgi:hypothetical protein